MSEQTLQGQWNLTRKIKTGTFGEVYYGEQAFLGVKAVIKIMDRVLCETHQIAAALQENGYPPLKVNHPGLAKIFAIGITEDRRAWFAVERLEGESLERKLLQQRASPPEELFRWFLPLCETLAEAHRRQCLHLNLKAASVWLCPAEFGERVMLADLGLSALCRGEQFSNAPYRSPELWSAQTTDERADIYALGILAYRALSGFFPWTADTDGGWRLAHCEIAPKSLEQFRELRLPEGLSTIVMRSISKRPEERPRTIRELIDALEAIQSRARSQTEEPPKTQEEEAFHPENAQKGSTAAYSLRRTPGAPLPPSSMRPNPPEGGAGPFVGIPNEAKEPIKPYQVGPTPPKPKDLPKTEPPSAPPPPPKPPPVATRPKVRLQMPTGEWFLLPEKDEFFVGRKDLAEAWDPAIDLTGQPDDQTVSRRHARLYWRDSTLLLEDLGRSKNGTSLNQEKLKPLSPRPLLTRDRVVFGNVQVIVEISE